MFRVVNGVAMVDQGASRGRPPGRTVIVRIFGAVAGLTSDETCYPVADRDEIEDCAASP